MKNKNLIIGAVVAVIFIAGILMIAKKGPVKTAPKKPVAATKVAKGNVAPVAKKTFAKGMGGLTVKIVNIKGKSAFFRIRAFKAVDSKSSAFISLLNPGVMQILPAGTYDLEIDASPVRIYKGINVAADKENIVDLGCITGALTIKALKANNKEGLYNFKILDRQSGFVMGAGVTNKTVETLPGSYDIEIGGTVSQVKKGVNIEAGKDTVIDLGVLTGSIVAKAKDADGKEIRYTVNIKVSGSSQSVATGATGVDIEVAPGTYDIELMSSPKQTIKNIKVSAGEVKGVDFMVQAQESAPPVKTVVKKK